MSSDTSARPRACGDEQAGPSLLLDLSPGPLNLVSRGPICGSSAVGQYEAHLCLIPVLDGNVCSLSHVPGVSAGGEMVLRCPRAQTMPLISPLA